MTVKSWTASVILGSCCLLASSSAIAAEPDRVPILVELFTSEGCSSCPPADAFLQKLDEQPVTGAQLIVLSEHVDYWNHDGWNDPYSSSVVTERQQAYSTFLHLSTVYTPQMVVDGVRQFSGVDAKKAQEAVNETLTHPKISMRVSDFSVDGTHVRAHIETGSLDPSYGLKSADLFVVVAQSRAESQVLRGENANRRLTHSAVVRKLTRVGKLKVGEKFNQQVDVKTDPLGDPNNLRVVAFLQDPSSGKVVGAAMKIAGQN